MLLALGSILWVSIKWLMIYSELASSSKVSWDRARCILAVTRPPWLEWASSMMIAKVRSRWASPNSFRMKGNFWTVEMMIFFTLLDELAQLG